MFVATVTVILRILDVVIPDKWLYTLQIQKVLLSPTRITYFQKIIGEWVNFSHFFLEWMALSVGRILEWNVVYRLKDLDYVYLCTAAQCLHWKKFLTRDKYLRKQTP